MLDELWAAATSGWHRSGLQAKRHTHHLGRKRLGLRRRYKVPGIVVEARNKRLFDMMDEVVVTTTEAGVMTLTPHGKRLLRATPEEWARALANLGEDL